MAPELQSQIFPSRAVSEGNVVVSNVVEEVNLIPVQSQACADRMDRGVAPSFIEEPAITVEAVEEVEICW